MKCQLCDGKGEYMHAIGGYRPCEHCNGTGKIIQTNEEWFCSLSTKEKAHELHRRCNYASIFGSPTAEEFEKWLKDVHEE